MTKEAARKKAPYRKRNGNGYVWAFGLMTVALIALWAWSAWSKPSGDLPGLQTYAEEGRDHVDPATKVTYKTDPPTSGAHSPTATAPSFYTAPQAAGMLVHSLEHGNIVIYYDPQKTPADVQQALKSYPFKFPGAWDGVVVAPRQQDEEVVLTAWRNTLPLKKWDKNITDTFVDKFRGRGPENPVR